MIRIFLLDLGRVFGYGLPAMAPQLNLDIHKIFSRKSKGNFWKLISETYSVNFLKNYIASMLP
jgi:hypothetical protein